MTTETLELSARDTSAAAFSSIDRRFRSLGRSAENAKRLLVGLLGVLGARELVQWTRASAEMIDANAKMADRLGITTQALSGIKLQADLSGVKLETVTTGMRTMTYATYQATLGLQTYTRAFDALNLDAVQFARLAPDKQLQTLLAHLAQIPNVTERNAVAYQIFGGRASEMINLIADGAEGLDRSTKQAEDWGLALNRVDSAKVEAMNDALTRSKGAMQGVANVINVALAPYVAALGEHFAEAAQKSHGFREEVASSMRTAATWIGYGANAVLSLRETWKLLELGVAGVLNFVIQRVNDFVQFTVGAYNKIAESSVGKKIGLPIIEFGETLDDVARNADNRIFLLRQEVHDLFAQPLPSERIRAALDDIAARAEENARRVAAARQKLAGGDITPIGATNVLEDAQFKIDELYRKRLETIENSFRTENQVIQDGYAQQLSIIEGANALHLLNDDDTKRLLEEAQLQHEAKLGNIVAQGALARRQFMEQNAVQQTQFVLGQLLDLSNGVASSNRFMFEINKTAGIANAIINTYVGVTRALSAYPPPLSIVMAGIQLAAGLAQVQQIKNAQFGSATSAPSVGGGSATPVTPASVPVPPPVAPLPPTKEIHLTIIGDNFSSQQVRDLIKQINEAQDDGVPID